jgi:hydroxymethylpyrimidine/phosphomethylpyrimidine kinase
LQCSHIVLDPVMVAKSGDKLLQDDAAAALKQALIPMADIITPNLPEASVLLDRDITTRSEMPDAARDLADLGCPHVLLKGGHLDGTGSSDLLFSADTGQILELPGKRIHTPNSHGTGCTLSSAICAGLARGMDIPDAVKAAKAYIAGALAAGADYSIGQGHGPVHHFFNLWSCAGITPPPGTDS